MSMRGCGRVYVYITDKIFYCLDDFTISCIFLRFSNFLASMGSSDPAGHSLTLNLPNLTQNKHENTRVITKSTRDVVKST